MGRPPYWREGGYGVSGGEQGAVAAPAAEKFTRKEKSKREGKNPNKEEENND